MAQEIRYTENGSYLVGSISDNAVDTIIDEAAVINVVLPQSILSEIAKESKIGFIYTIYVKPEHRGIKLGKKLTTRFCWEAEYSNVESVFLFADLSIEQAKGFDLVRFYKKQGFELVQNVGNYALMKYTV